MPGPRFLPGVGMLGTPPSLEGTLECFLVGNVIIHGKLNKETETTNVAVDTLGQHFNCLAGKLNISLLLRCDTEAVSGINDMLMFSLI